jgi:hypothetical protein
MRKHFSVCIVLLGFSAMAGAATQTATDSVEYNKAVAVVWGSITSTDNVVRWCMKNVPKVKKPIAAAYQDWKTKFAPLIADIDTRIDRVMNSSSNFTAAELAAHKADLLKRGAERYDAGLANEQQAEVKHECELLPGYFTTPSFDLEAHFAQELALIRAQPAEKPLETKK